MDTVTYNLKNHDNSSSSFYSDLQIFVNKILNHHKFEIKCEVNDYISYLNCINLRTDTFEETFYEYILIGVLMNENAGRALKSKRIIRNLAKSLFSLRKKYQNIKSYIDKIRGYVNTILIKEGKQNKIYSVEEFKIFIDWLESTGEYQEEIIKINVWYGYLKQLSVIDCARFLEKMSFVGNIFQKEAKLYLGKYTQNIDNYRANVLPEKKNKENIIFCGKKEVEYHLNMFGAQIMNQNLEEHFNQTDEKILLLPTCMSKPKKGTCQRIAIDNKIYCTGCSASCNINIYKRYCNELGISVNLIPHSSSFSKFLKEWQNQDKVGLIGVACVLNLIKGGYEMRKLNIPSQCIFLDYCGCKKHWHKDGIPTNIDIDMLDKMITKAKFYSIPN